jgi:putative hemolysin
MRQLFSIIECMNSRNSVIYAVALTASLTALPACAPADPTIRFCEQQGGRYESRHEKDIAVGYCIFPNNVVCNAWALYRAECRPTASSQQNASASSKSAGSGMAFTSSSTLQALTSKAELIFVGEVGQVIQRRTYSGYGAKGELLDGLDVHGNPVPQVPITDFEVKVEQVIKDDGAIAGGKPIILRMGGDATPEMKQVTAKTDYPFSFTGDRYLFLLSRNPDGVTYGFYYGPWSRLLVDGNTLRVSDGTQQILKLQDSDAAITYDQLVQQAKP